MNQPLAQCVDMFIPHQCLDAEAYESCPRQIRVRQVVGRRRGYQDTFFITSLADQRLASAREIVALYLRR